MLSEKFSEGESAPQKPYKATIFVNDKEISKMVGQKGANKSELLRLGWQISVKGKSSLKKYEINMIYLEMLLIKM